MDKSLKLEIRSCSLALISTDTSTRIENNMFRGRKQVEIVSSNDFHNV